MIKSRRMRWAGHVARMGEKMNAYRILMGKPEGKRPRRRWEDNIKMDLREIGWGVKDWIDLDQDWDHWSNEPSGSIACWKILEWLSDRRLLKKGSAPWSYLVRAATLYRF
jgi:hypothetical protein